MLETIFSWSLEHGIKILGILIVGYILSKISRTVIDKIVRKLIVGEPELSVAAEEKREETLIAVFSGTIKIVIYIIVVLMIVAEFGVNIAPLIAGAGIIGVAVGFGGQYLIRDLITGIFILLENQYRVGDSVDIAGLAGKVEDITLRVTVLRDLDGILHYIPHGEVTTVSNKTKGFSQVNITVGVSYDADLNEVRNTVNAVGEKMFTDEGIKGLLREAPYFLRVDDLADSSVNIKIVGKVEAGEQFKVAGELRQRVKEAFDSKGIEIPYPHIVVKN